MGYFKMKEKPFDITQHTVTIALQNHRWIDLRSYHNREGQVGMGDNIKEAVTMGLHELLDLRLILSQDKEFKEIYEAWIQKWNERRRDMEDALADSMSPEYWEAVYEDEHDYGEEYDDIHY